MTTTTVVCIKLRRIAGKKSKLNKRDHMWQNNKLQYRRSATFYNKS